MVRVGNALQEALKDPNGTIDKLIQLARLWAASKVLGGAMGAGGSLVSAGVQATIGLGQAGLIGGGTAAAGAAAAGGAGAAAGGAGTVATSAGLAALGAAAVTAGAALAALGGIVLAGWQAFKLWKDLKDVEANQTRQLTWEAENFVKTAAKMGNPIEQTSYAMEQLRDQGEHARAALFEMALEAQQAAASLRTIAARETAGKGAAITGWATTGIMLGLGQAFAETQKTPGRSTKATKHPGGGGGTSIQKVEIVVTSNQDPSRVARMVTDEIAKLARLRKSSPHVTNYASLTQRGGSI